MPHQCTTCGHVFDDGSKEMLSGCPDCGGNTFQFHPKGSDIPETPPDADPPEPEGSTAANTVGRAATKVRDFVSSDDSPEPDSTAGAPETRPTDPDRATESTGPTPGTTDDAAGTKPGSEARTTGDAAAGTDAGSAPDPNATWPSEEGQAQQSDLEPDDDGIIDADAREAARAVGEADEGGASTESGAEGGGSMGPDAASTEPGMGAADAVEGPVSGARDAGGLSDGPSGDGPDEGRVVSEPDGDQPDISELREQLNDQFESIKILEPGQYELNLMELYDREEYIIALQENGRYVIQVPEQWLGEQPGDA
ncbi:OapC/ArvC family zinc-ribbon domain-containing protein [Haloglomus salinum]|uniref:OapC/ArvC family zinc-ribbon domain-containing protein n=1 Tax=Haloglomus salinum TaxID=2962673 RepID=UPI0020C998EF|nr:Zn-ribbon containing protein [Haloglomus salinum]